MRIHMYVRAHVCMWGIQIQTHLWSVPREPTHLVTLSLGVTGDEPGFHLVSALPMGGGQEKELSVAFETLHSNPNLSTCETLGSSPSSPGLQLPQVLRNSFAQMVTKLCLVPSSLPWAFFDDGNGSWSQGNLGEGQPG